MNKTIYIYISRKCFWQNHFWYFYCKGCKVHNTLTQTHRCIYASVRIYVCMHCVRVNMRFVISCSKKVKNLYTLWYCEKDVCFSVFDKNVKLCKLQFPNLRPRFDRNHAIWPKKLFLITCLITCKKLPVVMSNNFYLKQLVFVSNCRLSFIIFT